MTSWTTNELEKIGAADELQIAPFKQGGTHYKPVIIWAVRGGYMVIRKLLSIWYTASDTPNTEP